MPVYEYACEKCGHEFEAEQRITEAPLKTCPRCRARRVRRLISQTSFVLKGGGWYSDLYSSANAKKDAKQEGGAEKEAGAGEGKAEAKAEPKSEPGGSSEKKSEPKPGKPESKGPKGKRGSAKAA